MVIVGNWGQMNNLNLTVILHNVESERCPASADGPVMLRGFVLFRALGGRGKRVLNTNCSEIRSFSGITLINGVTF